MIKTNQNFGLSGEFQVIVRRADGSIKLDTGMQPNLVIDNGLRFYLGLKLINRAGKETNHSGNFFQYCLVGTGNKTPEARDFALQNFVAKNVASRDKVYGSEEPKEGLHEGFVKVWERNKYVFDNINNQNITEVGLASQYGSETIDGVYYKDSYTLMTRSLIKDSSGTPIAVTVLEGEILEVIYQVNIYVDIKRQTGTFKLTTTKDGKDTVQTFDYFLQPYGVSNGHSIGNWLRYDNEYYGTTSWGVKETDDELDQSYDLNDEQYQKITHINTTPLDSKVSRTTRETRHNYSRKYESSYQRSVLTELSLTTSRISYEHTTGIYAHIHENGIRAYNVAIGWDYASYLVRGLVVVKNRENGQGIKKTNRQLWKFSHSCTITRWEE